MLRSRLILDLSFLVLWLSACSSQPSLTPTARPVPSDTPAPSATLFPSATPLATASLVPTVTLLPPTITPGAAPVLPAQVGTPVIQPAAVIAANNADKLRELARWGSGKVEDVTWTPDNRWLVVKTNFESYLFNSLTLAAPRFFEGNTIFTPAGLMAAFTSDGRIKVWQISDWTVRYELKGKTPVFSPDGKLLAALDGDEVHLVNAADGTAVAVVKQAGAVRLLFSPDSSLLVATSQDEVHAWKTGDGSEVFKSSAARILRTSFSIDGHLFFVQSQNQQGEAGFSIWHAPDWSLASIIKASGTFVLQPNGRQLFVYSNYPATGQISIFNLPDGKLVTQFRAGGSIYRLVISPDSTRMAISLPDPAAGVLALYDTTGKLIKKVTCENSCDAAQPVFSPDGKQVMMTGHLSTAGLDVGITLVYETASARFVRMLHGPLNVGGKIDGLAVSPDGSQIATYTGGQENELRVWETSAGKLVSSLNWGALTLSLGNLSPDGRQAVVFSDQAVVKVLKLGDGSLVRQFEHATQPLFSNGDLLLTVDLRHNMFSALHLWKASSGESVVVFPPDFTPPLVFSASDDLAVEAKGIFMRLIKLPSGRMVNSFIANGRPDVHLQEAAFSPDGSLIAVGDTDGGAWLWKISDRKPAFNFVGNHNPITGLAFSPDGKYFAVGSSDGTVNIRQSGDGQAALSLNLSMVLKAATGEDIGFDNLGGLTYSPDGLLLVTAGTINPMQPFPNRSQVMLLFQASDGKLLRILPGGGGRVMFTPDGKTLVASGDGALHVWGLLP